MPIFEQYPPCVWEVPGARRIAIPIIRLEEIFEGRIIENERPYRPGARLESTLRRARGWALTVDSYNSEFHEEGVEGTSQYPDVLNELCDSFDLDDTGTLTVPTRGPRRCRAHRYRRVETSTEVDAAVTVFEFLEDNEDDASVAAFQAPSAQSVSFLYATEAIDASQLGGASDDDLVSLGELAQQLEDLARSPTEFVTDMEAKAGNIIAATERVQRAFGEQASTAEEDVRRLLTDPENSRAHRTLERLRDVVATAVADAQRHEGRTVTRTYEVDLSIFDVASRESQDAAKLMPINQNLPDLFNIQRGTAVRIYERPLSGS